MTDISCPQCHQIDQVNKVSALVSAGTSRSSISYTSFSTYSQTDLSAKLASPDKPSYKEPITSGCAGIALFCGVAWLLAGIIGPLIRPLPDGDNIFFTCFNSFRWCHFMDYAF